jgi:tRNA pseudouridine55 synthase
MATGLMGILLGPSTRLSPYLICHDKEYRGSLVLGLTTDSLDVSGQVLERRPGPYPGPEEFRAAALSFLGRQKQVPPAISAIKVEGNPAWRLARGGHPPELPPREVEAYSIEILSYRPPEAEFRLKVSSGYYVRSFCRDLGAALGLGAAAMKSLRRLSLGPFGLSQGGPLPESFSGLEAMLISPREALGHLAEVVLGPDEARSLSCGQRLAPRLWERGDFPLGPVRVIGPEGRLIAIGEFLPSSSPNDRGGEPPRRPFLRPLRVLQGS